MDKTRWDLLEKEKTEKRMRNSKNYKFYHSKNKNKNENRKKRIKYRNEYMMLNMFKEIDDVPF